MLCRRLSLALLTVASVDAFSLLLSRNHVGRKIGTRSHKICSMQAGDLDPQAWSSSLSTAPDLKEAIREAANAALAGLPAGASLDLAIIHISSLYGEAQAMKTVIPSLTAALPALKNVLGATVFGVLGGGGGGSTPQEVENERVLHLTLASLPDVSIQPFHVHPDDFPSNPDELLTIKSAALGVPVPPSPGGAFLMYTAPQFIDQLPDFIKGIERDYQESLVFGALASTVSSLSRPLLIAWSAGNEKEVQASIDIPGSSAWLHGTGVVGVSLCGDISIRSYICQGARPVGPLFVVDGCEKTSVLSIRIAPPKGPDGVPGPAMPPLAAVRQLQKNLPAEDSAAVTRSLLVGTPSMELQPGAMQKRRRGSGGVLDNLLVRSIARGNMKDGSVIIPGPELEKGQPFQFFLRDAVSAAGDLSTALAGYKRRELEESMLDNKDTDRFQARGVLAYPCMDRGKTLFEEENFESGKISAAIPVPLGGFFCNGVFGPLVDGAAATLYGTSTGLLVFSSKKSRPQPVPRGANTEHGAQNPPNLRVISDESDDFVVERRDTAGGRALTSGPVQYSVIENTSKPKSQLEALVWAKETEVDRARDRWPLVQLQGRIRASAADPSAKTRDLKGALQSAINAFGSGEKPYPIIGSVFMKSPVFGSSRVSESIFDAVSMASKLEKGGAAALAVHSGGSFYGGKGEDITAIRAQVKVPILSADVVVYAYQIYQAKASGADAVRLISAALPPADLAMFHKVALKLDLQVVVTVSSEKHLLAALKLPDIGIVAISQIDLSTYTPVPGRALRLLTLPSVKTALADVASNTLVMVEGGVTSASEAAELRAVGAETLVLGEGISDWHSEYNKIMSSFMGEK